MKKPYFIIETANTHGGDFSYLMELVDTFSQYGEGYGIKFQAFHPDKIASQDYPSYDLYQQLYFDNNKWKEIIDIAAKTKDVWLDIFDTYGVEILKENFKKIAGIKFQTSVLYNFEVFQALNSVDLSTKKIIINVAAQPLENIDEILDRIQADLKPEEILLEFGYQAYPTTLEDSGFSKIEEIKTKFQNRLVFADHVDGKSEDAFILPLVVAMGGVDVIEKHVMLENKVTMYDHFSSITPEYFKKMTTKIIQYILLKRKPFINQKELEYLKDTIMVPILRNDKLKGSLLNIEEDFIYRRTGMTGLNVKEIIELQSNFHILATDKKAGDTIRGEDFKKAVVATIIACRLKSTRLPRKALLNIGGIASVERCIKSCLEFKNVNHTILATSDLEEDAELENYTYRKDVIFHKGEPDDVIRRYLSIAEKLNVDVIIRITADMPFVSHKIAELALNEHFKSGADYTVPRNASVGTETEIINTTALQKVKKHFISANYSEYMTWYFQNNPEYFRLKFFELPNELIRDYRLTLDYPEDLEMFNRLQAYFDQENKPFDIRIAFEFLDNNPEISNMNSHLTLRYKTDSELIDKLNIVTKITD
jgi:N,N'-diacetyllegionaminate synthase